MGVWLSLAKLRTLRGAEIDRLAAVGGVVDEDVQEAWIAAAESTARSYLSSRYKTNLPGAGEAPEVLLLNLARLAHQEACSGRSVPQGVTDDARRAEDWLSRVSRGIASLDLADAPLVDRSSAGVQVVQTGGSSAAFTPDTLRGLQ